MAMFTSLATPGSLITWIERTLPPDPSAERNIFSSGAETESYATPVPDYNDSGIVKYVSSLS